MADKKRATVEFLEFLADISHPATGAVQPKILAQRLGLTEAELIDRWTNRGAVSLPEFMCEILSVLDGIQDQTLDLNKTMASYRQLPLTPRFGARTADQVVSGGDGGCLARAIKSGTLPVRLWRE